MNDPVCTCVGLLVGDRHRAGCPELAEAMWMQLLRVSGELAELRARVEKQVACAECHHLFGDLDHYSQHLCVGPQGR